MTTRQEKIGHALLDCLQVDRVTDPDTRMSDVADMLAGEGMLDFQSDPEDDTGIAALARERYQAELRERALQGDRYAKSMLSGAAYHEPGDA